MHDFTSRAPQNSHHSRGKSVAAVVAVLFAVAVATLLGPALAHSAQPEDIEISRAPQATAPLAEVTDPGHDIAIQIVGPGQEGLDLSARLTEDGGLIERNISWTIRNSDGETVYRADTPGADLTLPPGDYAVEIRYGATRLASTVTLLEANRLMVSYVLNAGGLRVLPRVKDVAVTAARIESRIYALGGIQSGQLVATSDVPGEVLRVPAGDYRVESLFADGNARAVIDVKVNAGRMSAVNIDHKAGIARLTFAGEPTTTVNWDVTDGQGQPVDRVDGPTADVVLLPGTYTASARVGGELISATFEIVTGEARDIILGN